MQENKLQQLLIQLSPVDEGHFARGQRDGRINPGPHAGDLCALLCGMQKAAEVVEGKERQRKLI
jgi:hypothetical protein